MRCSGEKSWFLHRVRGVWDRLAGEPQWNEELAVQLIAACQEVAELAPTTQELAGLWVREKDTYDDAHKAEEKLMALIEIGHMDIAETEQL